MNVPSHLKYTNDHEWINIEGSQAYVGITDYAQSQLGDVIFVEVNTVGETLEKGQSLGTIEAVKTVSDIYMPVDGKILEFNQKIENQADLINKDPYGEGWIVRIEIINPQQLDELLDDNQYKKLIE